MTDLASVLTEAGGIRHYREEPDAADRHKREFRRRWPWHEMRPNDFTIVEADEEHFEKTFLVAKSSASQYGKRHGVTFKSWTSAVGGIIYRDK